MESFPRIEFESTKDIKIGEFLGTPSKKKYGLIHEECGWVRLEIYLKRRQDIYLETKTNSKILGFNKSSRPHFKGVLVSQLGVSAIEWGGG